MSRDDHKMYQAISRIDNGEGKREVAEELGVSYGTVMRWYREYEHAKTNNTLDALLDMDKLILATAGQLLESGVMVDEVEEGVAQVKAKLNKLEVLQEDFILTAQAINVQIRSRVMSAEHTSELVELADALCSLQNSFFNKNSTQVNVQNNYSGTESKYGGFLNDKPTH